MKFTDLKLNKVSSELAEKANKAQEDWIAPTLLNGWINSDISLWTAAGYYKDEMGIVRLRGTLKGGTATNYTVVFTLPLGYRPSKLHIIPVSGYSSNFITSYVRINTNGNVDIVSANTAELRLDSVYFRIV